MSSYDDSALLIFVQQEKKTRGAQCLETQKSDTKLTNTLAFFFGNIFLQLFFGLYFLAFYILSLHFQRSIFSGRIVTVIVTILHCMVTQQSRNTRTLVDYDGKHKLNVHSNKKKHVTKDVAFVLSNGVDETTVSFANFQRSQPHAPRTDTRHRLSEQINLRIASCGAAPITIYRNTDKSVLLGCCSSSVKHYPPHSSKHFNFII